MAKVEYRREKFMALQKERHEQEAAVLREKHAVDPTPPSGGF